MDGNARIICGNDDSRVIVGSRYENKDGNTVLEISELYFTDIFVIKMRCNHAEDVLQLINCFVRQNQMETQCFLWRNSVIYF